MTEYCIESGTGASRFWTGYGSLEQARAAHARLKEAGMNPGPIHKTVDGSDGFWKPGKEIK